MLADTKQMTDEELTSLTVQLIRNSMGLGLFVLLALILGRNTYYDLLFVLGRPREDIFFTVLTVTLVAGCLFFLGLFGYRFVGQLRDFKAKQVQSYEGLVAKHGRSFTVGGKKFNVHGQDFGTFEDGARVRVVTGLYSNSVLKIYRQG